MPGPHPCGRSIEWRFVHLNMPRAPASQSVTKSSIAVTLQHLLACPLWAGGGCTGSSTESFRWMQQGGSGDDEGGGVVTADRVL